jgi:hypothetical protein
VCCYRKLIAVLSLNVVLRAVRESANSLPQRQGFTSPAGVVQQPDRIGHNSPQPSLKPHPATSLRREFTATCAISILLLCPTARSRSFLSYPPSFGPACVYLSTFILHTSVGAQLHGRLLNTSPQPPPFRSHPPRRLAHTWSPVLSFAPSFAAIEHYADPEKGEEGGVDA